MALDRTWYNTLVDDNGTNTTGTLWDKAAVDSLMDAVDASLALMPVLPGTTAPTTTGNITAEPIPTGTGILYTYHNNATLKTIQGMVAGLPGQLWFHYSKGAGQVDFAHLHASGTALGKLKLFATVGLTSLAAGSGVAVFQYDATVTQWRLVTHDQGARITPTYAAGNFTANAGTWTVDSGDVINYSGRLSGKDYTLAWYLNTTSTGVGMGADLRVAIPAGLTSAKDITVPAQTGDNNVSAIGLAVAAAGLTFITLRLVNSAAWTSSVTNLTFARGEIAFEVQ